MSLYSRPATWRLDMVLLGLAGMKGAGKDTAAAILCREYGFQRIAFADALYQEVAGAFSVPIELLQRRATKETPLPELALRNCADPAFIAVVFKARGVARRLRGALSATGRMRPGVRRRLKKELAKPLSPRSILQWWGTEYRRVAVCDSYWRDQVEAAIRANPDTPWVITDVRFPDEAALVEFLGGLMVRVSLTLKPGLPVADSGAGAQHASERALDAYEFPVWENRVGDFNVLRGAVVNYAATAAMQTLVQCAP